MSLLTLGYSSARDGVYERAARGFYEKPSLLLLSMLAMALPLVFIFVYLIQKWSIKWQKEKKEFQEKLEDKTEEELKAELQKAEERLKKSMRQLLWCSSTGVFFAAIVNVQIIFLDYSNSVISRFNQELTIITPDITEQQRQIYQSRFASMKTRVEFVSLFEEINKTAEQHGKRKSDFIPW